MKQIQHASPTESRNPASENLDRLSALELVRLMNRADRAALGAVGRAGRAIAHAAERAAAAVRGGGRVIYMGAGTSGRLGLLDAVECRPTFGVGEGVFVGLIAGGNEAIFRAIEGAEDDEKLAEGDLDRISVSERDLVIGICASGATPYVLAGLRHASTRGAETFLITANPAAASAPPLDSLRVILLDTGPEILTGSTRLKAGTATKMALNMISTCAFVLLHKVFGNLMVDLKPTNRKLKARQLCIVAEAAGCSKDEARKLLLAASGDTKIAILMSRLEIGLSAARLLLEDNDGSLVMAMEQFEKSRAYPGI